MSQSTSEDPVPGHAPRLMNLARDAIRHRHYSYRTEQTYLHWMRRFILFSGKRHPRYMGAAEVTAFLNYLARDRAVAAATQNQALSALLFLYKEVLTAPLPWLDGIEHAKRPVRRPTVLTQAEIQSLLGRLRGTWRLMASLLYGAGLRLRERLTLRVKDVDFGYRKITVRDGKGGKDRVTILPSGVIGPLQSHLEGVKLLDDRDLAEGCGDVELPDAIARKYPRAPYEWGWKLSSRPTGVLWIRAPARSASPSLRKLPYAGREACSASRGDCEARKLPYPSFTRSRRTCSSQATTFARCRNCSGTRTYRPR